MSKDFERRISILEAETAPMPRTLTLLPGDEVPENITDFGRIVSVTRKPEPARDLTGVCADVLTVSIRPPRRSTMITRGSKSGTPEVECLEPEGFSE